MKTKKPKIWKLITADRKFSKYIIKRDKKCQRCKRKDRQLQCSHFWVRQHYSTRFDPDNCCAVCAWCHTFDKDNWENDRLGEYRAYMIKKLGKKGFEKLKAKHFEFKSKREAIIECMELLQDTLNST